MCFIFNQQRKIQLEDSIASERRTYYIKYKTLDFPEETVCCFEMGQISMVCLLGVIRCLFVSLGIEAWLTSSMHLGDQWIQCSARHMVAQGQYLQLYSKMIAPGISTVLFRSRIA